jgi:hypothetical protein
VIIIIADVDEVAALLGVTVQRDPEIVRPQTSGPCVHFDPDGVYSSDGDGEQGEHQDRAPACAYPSERGALCPHLDTPDILCPVKDACYAEQGEQDADMAAGEAVYETETPEFVEPAPEEVPGYAVRAQEKPGRKPHLNAWSVDEEAVIRRAYCAAEAGRLYSEAFPDSTRSAAAVTSRWYRLRDAGTLLAPDPLPDFAGDTVPVTQCEEPRSTGAPPYPWTGARVQIRSLPEFAGQIGTVVQYDPDSLEILVALDNSLDRIWLPPESLVLIGAGRGSP